MSPKHSGRKRRLRSEAAWVAATQILMVVAYAIGFRFITQYYPPEIFGEATLLTGLLMVIAALALNPFFAVHVRFYPDYRKLGLTNWFEGRIRRLLVIVFGAIAALALAVSLTWSLLDGWSRGIICLILFASLLAQAANALDTNVHSATRRQDRLALTRVLRVATYPAIAVAIAVAIGPSLPAILVAGMAGYLIPWSVSRLLGWQEREDDSGQPDDDAVSRLRTVASGYGMPFVVIALANWVSAVGDRYLLALNISVAEVGVYAAIYGLISQPYLMLAGGLSQWLRPIIFDAAAKGDIEKAQRLVARWLLAGVVCSLLGGTIIWIGIDFWFHLLLAKEYHYRGALVVFLLVANSMHVLTTVFSHQLMAVKETGAQIVPLAAGAVTNVLGNVILVPRMGIDGAGLATAISFATHALLMARAALRFPLRDQPG